MKPARRLSSLITLKSTRRALLPDLRQMILMAREQVARAIDGRLALLYWEIGHRIRQDILREKRAEYGEQIVATLSQQLSREFGGGWSRFNLARMVQFVERFSDHKIVATLSRQLGWSHFKEILPVENLLAREFYVEMCRMGQWSVRTLRQKIQSMLFERTALSKDRNKGSGCGI